MTTTFLSWPVSSIAMHMRHSLRGQENRTMHWTSQNTRAVCFWVCIRFTENKQWQKQEKKKKSGTWKRNNPQKQTKLIKRSSVYHQCHPFFYVCLAVPKTQQTVLASTVWLDIFLFSSLYWACNPIPPALIRITSNQTVATLVCVVLGNRGLHVQSGKKNVFPHSLLKEGSTANSIVYWRLYKQASLQWCIKYALTNVARLCNRLPRSSPS